MEKKEKINTGYNRAKISGTRNEQAYNHTKVPDVDEFFQTSTSRGAVVQA